LNFQLVGHKGRSLKQSRHSKVSKDKVEVGRLKMGKKTKKKSVSGSDTILKEKKKNAPIEEASHDKIDSRFAAAANRPQFLPQSKKSDANKVQIDDRFASVLTDPRFRVDGMGSGGVDKYGRKKKRKKKKPKDMIDSEERYGVEDELSAFYTVEKKSATDIVSNSEDEQIESVVIDTDEVDEDSDENKKEVEELKPKDSLSRIAYLQALSRGEISGDSSSESSSDDEDDSDSSVSTVDIDNDEEDPLNIEPGILDPSTKLQNEQENPIEITMESSSHLAVLNLDWVHVRAVDIFVILSSFSPPGSVKRVRVYPSDFGLERMKEEEAMGPTGIWKTTKKNRKDNSPEEDDFNEESESDDDSTSSADEADAIIEKAYKNYPQNENEAGENPGEETDFDKEKLRAYEASKLRYYFAVAEFNTAKNADVAYKEVDGIEMEHSSAAFDLRCIPEDQVDVVIEKRHLRDQAVTIPSNYVPPEFVVNALQQTNVKCTWEDEDMERSRKLTQYGVGNEKWDAMVEGDDLKAYLASDNSSNEDSDSDDEGEGEGEDRNKKGSKMRALLGLSGDEGSDDDDNDGDEKLSDGEKDDVKSGTKEFKYIPGQQDLSEKIRQKITTKQNGEDSNLTPWEQYLEKRREKKREKRKAQKEKRKNEENMNENEMDKNTEFETDSVENDDFFLHDSSSKNKKGPTKVSNIEDDSMEPETREPSSKEELELLLAGDNDIEAEKDYDMRGLLRIEKNAGKKLRGARKRKETKLRENVAGQDFQIDTSDKRFAALLEGDDRFGIDRQDPNYKETAAMKDILAEQTKRRSKKRNRKRESGEAKIASRDSNTKENNGKDLGSLVEKLKSKVARVEKRKKKKKRTK